MNIAGLKKIALILVLIFILHTSALRAQSFGSGTHATGTNSAAFGAGTTASAPQSAAFGSITIASGTDSVAFGFHSTASGNYSTASGYFTTASGNYSVALGGNTSAGIGAVAIGENNHADHWVAGSLCGANNTSSGNYAITAGAFCSASAYSIAIGEGATASNNSVSIGWNTLSSGAAGVSFGYGAMAVGDYSTASGYFVTAGAAYSCAVGSFNGGLPNTATENPSAWVATDPIFEVGNGYIPSGAGTAVLSDALVVYKNGNTTITGTDNELPNQALVGGGSIVTVALGDARYLRNSAAGGEYPEYSLGYETTASNRYATALGWNTSATGPSSTALGAGTTASGNYSTASGNYATASGNYSSANGQGTSAVACDSFVVGAYNTPWSNPEGNAGYTWNPGDPVFEVGNGTSPTATSDALIVYKNGDMTVKGTISVSGTTHGILVYAAGDISMGGFVHGPRPK